MKNIVKLLGTQDFMRVRIGVGAKPKGWDLADYVLAHLTQEDFPPIKEAIEHAADAVELILSDGIDIAMNRFN